MKVYVVSFAGNICSISVKINKIDLQWQWPFILRFNFYVVVASLDRDGSEVGRLGHTRVAHEFKTVRLNSKTSRYIINST